jgi:hypothetical protein
VVPYRLAFVDVEPQSWQTVYYVFNGFFFIDCIVNFFTTYTDDEKNVEIIDRKKICLNYLKSWFLIDLMSCLPFDLI